MWCGLSHITDSPRHLLLCDKEALKKGTLYATVTNDAELQGRAVFELAYSVVTYGKAATSVEGFDGKYLLLDYKAFTAEDAYISIEDLELIERDIPKKQLKMIMGWAAFHQEELRENWELAQKRQELYPIAPLR